MCASRIGGVRCDAKQVMVNRKQPAALHRARSWLAATHHMFSSARAPIKSVSNWVSGALRMVGESRSGATRFQEKWRSYDDLSSLCFVPRNGYRVPGLTCSPIPYIRWIHKSGSPTEAPLSRVLSEGLLFSAHRTGGKFQNHVHTGCAERRRAPSHRANSHCRGAANGKAHSGRHLYSLLIVGYPCCAGE